MDRIGRPNHFTPVPSIIAPNSAIENTASVVDVDNDVTYVESNKLPSQTALRVSKSKITHANQPEDEKENSTDAKNLVSVSIKRQIFLEAPAVIQYMIDAVKEGKVFEQPPKMITHTSMFTVKLIEENILSVGKDGNGIWTQVKSVKTIFMLKESDKYQIVRLDNAGKAFYNERIGNKYVSCPENSNQVITIHR